MSIALWAEAQTFMLNFDILAAEAAVSLAKRPLCSGVAHTAQKRLFEYDWRPCSHLTAVSDT